jgi:septum site-determining protein MinC
VVTATRLHPTIRLRGRSYLALVLTPARPISAWLSELDSLLCRSPAAFIGRPIVLDLSNMSPSENDLRELVADLGQRAIRVMAIEGVHCSFGVDVPPMISGGRASSEPQIAPEGAPETSAAVQGRPGGPGLLLEAPIRSGQSIMFLGGDVTIVGSVASGAEVIAGGSIHVYGALRGRAIAGASGGSAARIFCRKFEPELVAIDGLYESAESIAVDLRRRPVQVWLDGEQILMRALD